MSYGPRLFRFTFLVTTLGCVAGATIGALTQTALIGGIFGFFFPMTLVAGTWGREMLHRNNERMN